MQNYIKFRFNPLFASQIPRLFYSKFTQPRSNLPGQYNATDRKNIFY